MNLFKNLILVFILLSIPYFVKGQQYSDIGSCFSKSNKKSINKKMDNFLSRVSEETNCPKENITYVIVERYTTFYSKECRHLPKKISFNSCGKSWTYKHNGLSGAVLYWLLGSWTLEKDK